MFTFKSRLMKKIVNALLLVLLVVATSCNKDETVEGEEMRWEMPSEFVQLNKGTFQVPAEGGSFTLTCENYEPWIEVLHEIGPEVTYDLIGRNKSTRSAQGQWIKVECVKKKVHLTFTPVTVEEPHGFEIMFSSGNVSFTFIFVQTKRQY